MGLDPLHPRQRGRVIPILPLTRSRAAASCVAPRLPEEAGKVPGSSRAHHCLLPGPPSVAGDSGRMPTTC